MGVRNDLISWFETHAANVAPAVFQSAVQFVFSTHQQTPVQPMQPQPMQTDSKVVKPRVSEPPKLQGDSSDPPLKAWLGSVRLWLSLGEVPAEKQFLYALGRLSPKVVTAVFRDYDTIMQEAEMYQYTFDDLCDKLTSNKFSSSQYSTNLQRMYACGSIRIDLDKPDHRTALTKYKEVISLMTVQPDPSCGFCNQVQCYFMHKLTHPEKKQDVAYKPDGTEWDSAAEMDQHLINVTVPFDSNFKRKSSSRNHPAGFQAGGARDRRQQNRYSNGNGSSSNGRGSSSNGYGNNSSKPPHYSPYPKPSDRRHGNNGSKGKPDSKQSHPELGTKCYNCQGYGHTQFTCSSPRRNAGDKKTQGDNNNKCRTSLGPQMYTTCDRSWG
eukprot:GHUV01014293.1.p1 GENE.GHUV01014293.1~~GHUV01014293.1.p1  ORF type:complete len:381 (+),score=98.68 GHUV01014293.1:291-1433(+)